jgi:hypothetical protein
VKEKLDPAEIAYLADRAVKLIDDARSNRIDKNRELAEVIMACSRKTAVDPLERLKWLLNQGALEHPDLQYKHPNLQGTPDEG